MPSKRKKSSSILSIRLSTLFPLTILVSIVMQIGCRSIPQQNIFIHPGILNNTVDLDFVEAKIKAEESPWNEAFLEVKKLTEGTAKPLLYIDSNNEDAYTSRDQAKLAYANALVWRLTKQVIYKKRAINILNSWANLKGFTGGNDQDKLQAGWIGVLFASAAEIMRTSSSWDPKNILKFQQMFKRAFYPQLIEPSSWNGNVDLTQIDALMSISVFNDDKVTFNLAIERFKKRIPAYFYLLTDASVPAIEGDGGNIDVFWSNPTKWIDGLTQETCRDNLHHTQYALASSIHIAETAWNQGIDLYSEYQDRFTACMELTASQLLSGNMQNICPDNTATKNIFATWEIAYNHYHHRKQIQLPNTKKLILQKVRTQGQSDWNIFYETLTHANLKIEKK